MITGVDQRMKPIIEQYGENKTSGNAVAQALKESLFLNEDKMADKEETLSNTYDFLADCHGLHVYVAHLVGCFISLSPTAGALWDRKFIDVVEMAQEEIGRVELWTKMQLAVHGAQTLVVPTLVKVQEKRVD